MQARVIIPIFSDSNDVPPPSAVTATLPKPTTTPPASKIDQSFWSDAKFTTSKGFVKIVKPKNNREDASAIIKNASIPGKLALITTNRLDSDAKSVAESNKGSSQNKTIALPPQANATLPSKFDVTNKTLPLTNLTLPPKFDDKNKTITNSTIPKASDSDKKSNNTQGNSSTSSNRQNIPRTINVPASLKANSTQAREVRSLLTNFKTIIGQSFQDSSTPAIVIQTPARQLADAAARLSASYIASGQIIAGTALAKVYASAINLVNNQANAAQAIAALSNELDYANTLIGNLTIADIFLSA